jgi:Ca-activated chloride channel homolog
MTLDHESVATGIAPRLVAVDGREYPLESVRLDARAAAGLARTTLTQVFHNPYDEPLEVSYTMPLPAEGAVIGYTIRFGEQVIRGEVRKRTEAAARYDAARIEGRLAALLEMNRDDVFHQKLGSLPGRQQARIEIDILQPLAFVPAEPDVRPRWEYRFPTVTGMRYHGSPGRVPDAARLDADRAGGDEIPTRLELTLVIEDGAHSTAHAISSTHPVTCADDPAGTRVELEHGVALDRDLAVRWSASDSDVAVQVCEGPGLPGDPGRYALVTVTPPAIAERVLARDLTVLIDASGSMSGAPLACAQALVTELLLGLTPRDRFEVLGFAERVEPVTRGMRPAHPSEIEQAIRGVHAMRAGGGTEMRSAVESALAPLRAGSQCQVILITDGQIGFEAEVIGRVAQRLSDRSRLHVVGVSSTPNRSLTRALARAGRGVAVLVEDTSAVATAAARLNRATIGPVLTDLTVSGSAVTARAPARARDVFAGMPVTLAVELDAAGGMIEVTGQLAGGHWQRSIVVAGAGTAPAATRAPLPLPVGALFGREAIADLELERAGGLRSPSDADQRIEMLGLRHRIASRLTSFVAVSETPAIDPRDPSRRVELPVETPFEVSPASAGMWMARSVPILHQSEKVLAVRALKELLARDYMGQECRLPSEPPSFHRKEWVEGPSVICGRTLAVRGNRLTIEFEVPNDGFRMPRGRVAVVVPGSAQRLAAIVVKRESTHAAKLRAGLTVRLVLEVADGGAWPADATIAIQVRGWMGPRFDLQVSIPRGETH